MAVELISDLDFGIFISFHFKFVSYLNSHMIFLFLLDLMDVNKKGKT